MIKLERERERKVGIWSLGRKGRGKEEEEANR